MKNNTALLRELCDVCIGRTPSRDRPDFWGGPNAWVSIADLNETVIRRTKEGITDLAIDASGCQPVEPGTLLLSFKLSLGKVAFAGTRLFTNEAIAALPIRDPNRIDSRYLYYRLHSVDWASLGRRAVKGNCLNKEILEEAEILYPDLSEQRLIAGRLEQADRLRHTRRYALQLTDAFLPAAFLELFGDPAQNPRAFDRVQLETLFAPSRDGAKCGPFGSALKKHEYVAAGIPVWTMNNVGANEFTEDGCLFISPVKFEELAAYDAQNGDILISRAGTVGRMAIVRTAHQQSIIHSNIIRLSLDHTMILPVYFVALMTWFAPKIARLKRGQEDAYTFMRTGSLGELQIPLPPFSLQLRFAALVERVERLRAVQREALRQAEHLFASLLHSAFNGLSESVNLQRPNALLTT